MDKSPPEIHSRIFAYACMDGGETGRSLSLVSRYIREVSTPYQWQSVVLEGAQYMLKFADLTDRAKDKRPIYHLFLSDGSPYFPLPNILYTDSKQIDQSRQLRDALKTILSYAASSLDTLTFYSQAMFLGGGTSIAHLLSISYPHLTELTIRGRCTPVQLTTLSTSLEAVPREMPSLRRLHLAIPCHGFAYGNLQQIHDFMRIVAPRVTHFRLSMLDMWGSRRVAEVLHAELAASGIVRSSLELPSFIGEPSTSAVAQEVTWDRLLSKSLQLFAIQPSPTRNFYCSCCMQYRGDVDVMRVFEKLAEEADPSRFLFFNKQSPSCMGYGSNEAKRDWLERTENGYGCWGQRKEIIEEEVDDRYRPIRLNSTPPLTGPVRIQSESSQRKTCAITRLRKLMKKLRLW